jgi:NAD(P)-dependent dehydrogenase (short-subunit alcohol dehydrogenase family)
VSRTFVTGATGLLGRHLTERLLARGGEVVLLVRQARLEAHAERLAALSELARKHGAKLSIVHGDVTEPWLGLASGELEPSALDHVFHVAGHYDLTADAKTLRAINVEGTENVLEWLASRGFRGVLHHVSSIAVAGDFSGRFGEAMLDAGQGHPTEYHRTKYESELRVRAETRVKHRIYRPGAIVGHSRTGEMDRIDGAYYLFRGIHALRDALPRWVTLPGLDGAPLAMVPVDFVADAIDAIAHRPGLDGRTFHVVDGAQPTFRDTFNLIADAAGAPRMGKLRLSKLTKWIPGGGDVIGQLGAVAFLRGEQLEGLGIPKIVLTAQNREVSYDTTGLDEALLETKVRCPPQASYVEPLWDYYVRNLDPARDPSARDRKALAGKVMLVTGASSGIGEALAKYGASIGMKVVIVARRDEELSRVEREIREQGGIVSRFVADLSDLAACDAAVQAAIDRHGRLDVLVNNAARSIRRPLAESLERFHDLERLMQINYYGPARLIRAALPGMVARKYGVILNVLSAGARAPSPRFGAYTASKAALGQLGDTLAAEHLHDGIRVLSAFLPWVRTPMMGATGKYDDTHAMTPERAARWMIEGIVTREQHVLSGDVRRRFMFMAARPESLTRVMNVLYRIYADDPESHPELALDRMILKRFVKGRLM